MKKRINVELKVALCGDIKNHSTIVDTLKDLILEFELNEVEVASISGGVIRENNYCDNCEEEHQETTQCKNCTDFICSGCMERGICCNCESEPDARLCSGCNEDMESPFREPTDIEVEEIDGLTKKHLIIFECVDCGTKVWKRK